MSLKSTGPAANTCVTTYGWENSGSGEFEVKHYVDADTAKQNTLEAIAAGEESGHDDETGLCLWPASFLLIEWLASRQAALPRLTVLELGSGCGLVGLAASCLGAKKVELTDGSDEAVRLAAENIKANASEDAAHISLKLMRWGSPVGRKFDIVTACEVNALPHTAAANRCLTRVCHPLVTTDPRHQRPGLHDSRARDRLPMWSPLRFIFFSRRPRLVSTTRTRPYSS